MVHFLSFPRFASVWEREKIYAEEDFVFNRW